jgi:hypothetical protein
VQTKGVLQGSHLRAEQASIHDPPHAQADESLLHFLQHYEIISRASSPSARCQCQSQTKRAGGLGMWLHGHVIRDASLL